MTTVAYHSAGEDPSRGELSSPAVELLGAAFDKANASMTRLEAIITAVEESIESGAIIAGTRLPTVRMMSKALKVSPSTVLAAYGVLNRRGRIAGAVGRGTYVLGGNSSEEGDAVVAVPCAAQWRRRTAAIALDRMPRDIDFDAASGRPDTSLILAPLVRRAMTRVAENLGHGDLQYSDAEPLAELRDAVLPRLRRDGIPTAGTQLVIGSSALQLMLFAVSLATRAVPGDERLVAVEQPGYLTALDALEHAGCRLTALDLDDEGVTPESLDRALTGGALAAVLTPRAQNPTGASWTGRRRVALTRVADAHPQALIVEVDAFADLAEARPGTLLDGGRCGDRVVYIRGFAKTIAPDIRVAAAVARPQLAERLTEMKALRDGWTSRLSQRVLAATLVDSNTDAELAAARASYRLRRETVLRVLTERLGHLGVRSCGADGLYIWLCLPPGLTTSMLVGQAAANGIQVASGEPFFVRPGHQDAVRISVGGIPHERAEAAANLVAEAVLTCIGRTSTAIMV